MNEMGGFGLIRVVFRLSLMLGFCIFLAVFRKEFFFSKISAKLAHFESDLSKETKRALQNAVDEGEYKILWDIDLGDKDFLLASNYLKAGLELSVKEFINRELICEEESNDQSAAFYSLEILEDNLNKMKKISGNGKCKGTRKKCKKRIRKTVSDVARVDICENLLGTTLFDLFNDTVVTASFFNYNVNVELINDLSGALDLKYDVTFEESTGDGLNQITEVDFAPQEPEKFTIPCDARCEEQRREQRSIMLEIYNHFDLPFENDKHECLFEGINCNTEDLVTQIWLENYDFSGKTIPEAFLRLPFLVGLFLGGNQLGGVIPPKFGGGFFKLEMLWLQDNALTGQIPSELGNLRRLKEMNLHGNRFTGTIPSELGRLKKARFLSLSRNNLIGTIPFEFGGSIVSNESVTSECRFFRNQAKKLRLTWLLGIMPSSARPLEALEVLSLYENNLSGSIPATFSNMSQLTELSLADNNLTGNLPSRLEQMRNLVSLDFHGNNISGLILDEIGSLRKLQVLNLYNNRLEKSVPTTIGLLSQLKELILDENELTGPLPTYVGNLRRLKYFSFSGNKMSGEIPSEIGNLTSLINLDIRDYTSVGERNGKRGGGTIPSELGNLRAWKYPVFLNNGIVGTIPSELGRLVSAEFLWLRNQELSGTIPNTFANLKTLSLLSLGNNSLDGTIPSTLGILNGLKTLDLGMNSLSGTIPPEITSVFSLNFVNFGSNKLNGPIPSEIGRLSLLEYLNAENNLLDEKIPSEIGDLDKLLVLDLAQNSLTGTIPTEMGDMESLVSLAIGANELTGVIPLELGNIESLESLNLVNNTLIGKVPTDLVNIIVVDGNDVIFPSSAPSFAPTRVPSFLPTTTLVPSFAPSLAPTATFNPSLTPTTTSEPSLSPSFAPTTTFNPSLAPSLSPSASSIPTSASFFNPFKIMASDGVSEDMFGLTVAVSDEYFAVGTYNNSGVYMYDSRGEFVQKIIGPFNSDSFGREVAICRDTLVIGSLNGAYLYYSNGTFGGALKGSNAPISDVDCSDDTIVVGSHTENNLAGAAYIYDMGGNLVNRIVAPNPAPSALFGWSVAVSAGRVAVGAPFGEVGEVHMFTITGSYERVLRPPGGQSGVHFGHALAMSDSLVLVGHYEANSESGEAYIFLTTTGELIERFVAPDASQDSWFGFSLAIANEIILIGAPQNGAVYTFFTNGTFVNKFKAPGAEFANRFGYDVAISGKAGIIGSIGVNEYIGAAYIYPKLSRSSFGNTFAPTISPT